jgi:hypothetical protein
MIKRLLEATPKEVLGLKPRELLDTIRASEGRTINAYVCPRSANYVEKVSNVELAASFGADMIFLEGYDPWDLQMPGLPSRGPKSDEEYRNTLQVQMGYGWTIRELKELVGRPIGTLLMIPEKGFDPFIGGIFTKHIYTKENLEFIIQEGYDFVLIVCLSWDPMVDAVKEAAEVANGRIIIEAGLPHGPGVVFGDMPPYNLRNVTTPELVSRLAKAGADIVDIPSVGMVPGFTMDYVTEMAAAIHEGHSLVASCIAHSLEGADPYTIKRIAIDNKTCGADIFALAAGGVYESVPLPETLLDMSIAVKGRRHTYRRMCQSPLR